MLKKGDKVVIKGVPGKIYMVYDHDPLYDDRVAITTDPEFHDWDYIVPPEAIRLATETELIIWG